MVANLDGPEFGDRAARQEQTALIMPLMGTLALQYTAQEFYEKAQSIGQPWAMVKTPDEALVDPHHVARGFPQVVEHPERGARYTYPGAPWVATASPYVIRGRAPFLGEHGEEIRMELGIAGE
jgi:crotonobetainyl-CoA:carnitine CoA-transferase CaiB-like acyl-CoA transferase